MTLQKQIIEIPFGQGMDEKVDPKLLPNGSFAIVNNVSFDKQGRAQKRGGNTQVSTKRASQVFGNGNSALQMYSAALDNTSNSTGRIISGVGTIELPITAVHTVTDAIVERAGIKNGNSAIADSCIQGSYLCVATVGRTVASTALSNVVSVTVKDSSTLTTVSVGSVTTGAGDSINSIRAVKHNTNSDYIMISVSGILGGATATILYSYRISTNTFVQYLNVATRVYAGAFPLMELCNDASGNTFLAISHAATATDIRVYLITANWAAISPVNVTAASTPYTLAMNGNVASSGCVVAFVDSAGLKTFEVDNVASVASISVAVGVRSGGTVGADLDAAAANPSSLLVSNPDSTKKIMLFLTRKANGAAPFAYYTLVAMMDSSHAILATDSITGFKVHSKPIAASYDNSSLSGLSENCYVYCLPVDDSPIISNKGYYVFNATYISSSGADVVINQVGRMMLLETDDSGLNLSPVHNLTYGTSFFCTGYSSKHDDGDISFSSPASVETSVSLMRFSQDIKTPLHGVNVCGGYLFCGGALNFFDGATCFDNGVQWQPEIFGVTYGGVGGLSAGSYSWSVVLEYIDGLGNLHRTAPSRPFTATATAAQAATVTIEMPFPTGLNATLSGLRWSIYRTVANGSTYYKVGTVGISSYYGSVSTAEISFADSTITDNEILYTQGGELSEWQIDAPIALATGDSRVYAVSGNYPNRVYVSKPIDDGFGISFMQESYRDTPSEGGKITALAMLNNRVIAFKQRAAYVAVSGGPDVTGANDTFGEFIRISPNVGAFGFNGVLETSIGVIAYGPDGFHLFGNDASAQYIGGAVEDSANVAGYTCKASVYIPARKEARFSMSDGSVLVLDLENMAWSKHTGIYADSMLCVNDSGSSFLPTLFFSTDATNAGAVDGVFSESLSSPIYTQAQNVASNNYNMDITTGWIKIGSTQAWAHLYRIMLLGGNPNNDDVGFTVALSYDFVDTVVETHAVVNATATAGSSAYQFEIKPTRQRCQSVKIRIYEASPEALKGAHFNLLSLEFGVESDLARLAVAKRA